MAQAHHLNEQSQRRSVRLPAAAGRVTCLTAAAARWASDHGSDRLELGDVLALAGDGCGRRGWQA